MSNNIVYIANLMALKQWYNHVRSQFISSDFPEPLLDGLKEKLAMAVDERIGRLKEMSQKMPESVQVYKKITKENASPHILQQKNELYNKWSELEEFFRSQVNLKIKGNFGDRFREKIRLGIINTGKDYIPVIKNLSGEDKELGTRWLQGIVDHVTTEALKIMSTFNI